MNTKLFAIYTNRTDFWFQFAGLYLLTVCAQLSNIAYQTLSNDASFVATLVPSLMFLSAVTIPSILAGLLLGRPLGLGLVNDKEAETDTLKEGVRFALVTAVILGCTLLAIRWGVSAYLPEALPAFGFRGPVSGLLISLGAGIGEEIWFRFGLMTLLLFLLKKVFNLTRLTNRIVLWVILFVGVCFGLAHLPQLISFGANDAFSILATVMGNVCVASLFGWCFWRYGLIAAVVAHVSLDLVLHFVPAFF